MIIDKHPNGFVEFTDVLGVAAELQLGAERGLEKARP